MREELHHEHGDILIGLRSLESHIAYSVVDIANDEQGSKKHRRDDGLWKITDARHQVSLDDPYFLELVAEGANAYVGSAWMHNCRQSPGEGSAMCRTWNSTSMFSSSIQYGRSMSNGTLTSRRRKTGSESSRDSKNRSTSLNRT